MEKFVNRSLDPNILDLGNKNLKCDDVIVVCEMVESANFHKLYLRHNHIGKKELLQ